ncbi:MAG: NUDIX hydrolase [Acidimicrobiales bacterium]
MSDPHNPPATPAATVILLRDSSAGVETLMLHRTSKVAFGGMWVFPGGRVDEGDSLPEDPDDQHSARRAAVREAAEECSLLVDPSELVAFSHWTPPPDTPRRYATWFFVARASTGEVLVDGGEIRDHAWLTPQEVLDRRARGEVDLAPPTFVTLSDLAAQSSVEAALASAARRDPVPRYETRWGAVDGGVVALWHGDAGYESNDPEASGPRHRLWMRADGWVLERD